MNNQQAWRGSVGVSAYQGIISPAYHIYKLSNDLLPEFANLLFRSRPMVFLYEQVSRGVGNIQRNLDGSSLKNIPVVYPSIQAQFTSVEEVARISNSCASTIEVLDQSISRLEELKKSILTHVITGVLDVRAGKDFL
jgi:type I restriction enzyme S subunit